MAPVVIDALADAGQRVVLDREATASPPHGPWAQRLRPDSVRESRWT